MQRITKIFILTIIVVVNATTSQLAQNSVLQSGYWVKLAVKDHGVYRINRQLLESMGFSAGTLDPRKIKIFGNPGGILPQENNKPRPNDLTELSIFVSGENDGVFNSQDYILFYAQGPDKVIFNPSNETVLYENNFYTDNNYYFITVSETNGKRVQLENSPGSGFSVVGESDQFIYYENDQNSLLKSGREWFGETFNTSTTSRNFNFTIPNIIENSTIKFISDVVARSNLGSTFSIVVNDVTIGEQYINPLSSGQYESVGRHKRDTFLINTSTISAHTRSQQTIQYQYARGSSTSATGYLDYFLIQFKQRLLFIIGQQLKFRSFISLDNPASTFAIQQSLADVIVWDVTDPSAILQQQTTFNAGITNFNAVTASLREFIAFQPNAPAPEIVGTVPNQNLHALQPEPLIIITHPDFKTEAQRLVNHRATQNNISSILVTTQEVFNEFASGREDITAIRDFVKHIYEKNPTVVKSLLLFGKTSYDYRNITVDNRNYIPTYQSRNSLNPLASYSSDDYYGFLEDNEGYWSEEPAINHTLDIGVGRLPIRTMEEAANVVDKLIVYDEAKKNSGLWKKRITFVADDGNSVDGFTFIHQRDADLLAQMVEDADYGLDARRIFLGMYQKTLSGSAESIPQVQNEIIKAFNEGSLIINYTGHGAERLWGDERVFDDLTINGLTNKIYPFLVTATCEFGRHDDPIFLSGGEQCILKRNGGAIGLITTTRLVNASSNFQLNNAFYDALLFNGAITTLGEAFQRTKNNSFSGVGNRNFSLLADPSMMLAIPPNQIVIAEIQTADGSDVLKALSTVTVRGEIQNAAGNKLTNFQGIASASLFDKEASRTTIGRNNPPFTYQEWSNAIFRGTVTVENGEFEFSFVVPKNIAYTSGIGRISLYAFDPQTKQEASGYSESFTIGSSDENPTTDNTPPMIEVFMNDETFVSGGMTTPDPILLVKLQDAQGINISGYGLGNSLTALLDNEQSFTLNDYYVANQDDYTTGVIQYPLSDISPGKHTITVKAWDTHNNPTQQTISFYVTDGSNLQIEELLAAPNPMSTTSNLIVKHNVSGHDLLIKIDLVDRLGQVFLSQELFIESAPYSITLAEINKDKHVFKNLTPGIYYARIVMRSLTNGSKNERVTKLIIMN